MAEIAAWAKDQGKTLFGILESIYAEYGFSQEKMVYIVRKGLTGAQEIKDMMNNLRHNTPKTINNSEIIIKKDYATLQEINLKTGETKPWIFQPPVTYFNSSWPTVAKSPFVLPVPNPK